MNAEMYLTVLSLANKIRDGIDEVVTTGAYNGCIFAPNGVEAMEPEDQQALTDEAQFAVMIANISSIAIKLGDDVAALAFRKATERFAETYSDWVRGYGFVPLARDCEECATLVKAIVILLSK